MATDITTSEDLMPKSKGDKLKASEVNALIRASKRQAQNLSGSISSLDGLAADDQPKAKHLWIQARATQAIPKFAVLGMTSLGTWSDPPKIGVNCIGQSHECNPLQYFTNGPFVASGGVTGSLETQDGDPIETQDGDPINSSGGGGQSNVWVRPIEFDRPVLLQVDINNIPEIGKPCGPKPNTFTIAKEYTGFMCLSEPHDQEGIQVVWVVLWHSQNIVCKSISTITAYEDLGPDIPGTGQVSILTRDLTTSNKLIEDINPIISLPVWNLGAEIEPNTKPLIAKPMVNVGLVIEAASGTTTQEDRVKLARIISQATSPTDCDLTYPDSGDIYHGKLVSYVAPGTDAVMSLESPVDGDDIFIWIPNNCITAEFLRHDAVYHVRNMKLQYHKTGVGVRQLYTLDKDDLRIVPLLIQSSNPDYERVDVGNQLKAYNADIVDFTNIGADFSVPTNLLGTNVTVYSPDIFRGRNIKAGAIYWGYDTGRINTSNNKPIFSILPELTPPFYEGFWNSTIPSVSKDTIDVNLTVDHASTVVSSVLQGGAISDLVGWEFIGTPNNHYKCTQRGHYRWSLQLQVELNDYTPDASNDECFTIRVKIQRANQGPFTQDVCIAEESVYIRAGGDNILDFYRKYFYISGSELFHVDSEVRVLGSSFGVTAGQNNGTYQVINSRITVEPV